MTAQAAITEAQGLVAAQAGPVPNDIAAEFEAKWKIHPHDAAQATATKETKEEKSEKCQNLETSMIRKLELTRTSLKSHMAGWQCSVS